VLRRAPAKSLSQLKAPGDGKALGATPENQYEYVPPAAEFNPICNRGHSARQQFFHLFFITPSFIPGFSVHTAHTELPHLATLVPRIPNVAAAGPLGLLQKIAVGHGQCLRIRCPYYGQTGALIRLGNATDVNRMGRDSPLRGIATPRQLFGQNKTAAEKLALRRG
jgi:hypothetical protein